MSDPTSSSCSTTSTAATTFHPFPKLPYELRHVIWSFALPRSRILHFRTNDDLETYLDRRRELDEHLWLATSASAVPPVTLSIDQESRDHTLKFYRSLKAPYENLMVDFENDLWWLEHRNRGSPDYTSYASASIPDDAHGLAAEDKKRIRNLLIYDPNTQARDIPLAISFWLKALGGHIKNVHITSQNERLGFSEWADCSDGQLSFVEGLKGWWDRAREEFGEHVVEPRGVRVCCTPSVRGS